MPLSNGLEGKVAVVTGAAGGIGRAVAIAFAAAGSRVFAVDRKQDVLDDLLRALGDNHSAMCVDLLDQSAPAAIIESAVHQLGAIDVLAQAAAVIHRRHNLPDITEQDWDLQLDINLKAAFFVCRAAGEQMVRQGDGGRIVTFASQAWWTGGYGGSIVYAASKGGVVSMTRGLARIYGPHGITANCVAPGLVRTPMMLDSSFPEDTLKSLIASTPLGRLAEPEEIADVVVYLSSKQASFVSGATINVSGGLLMY